MADYLLEIYKSAGTRSEVLSLQEVHAEQLRKAHSISQEADEARKQENLEYSRSGFAENLNIEHWMARAACKNTVKLFFGPPFERKQEKLDREAKAKSICDGCPVRVECLETALDRNEKKGIWGGLAESERAEILRNRA